MGFWLTLGIYIAGSVLMELLRPRMPYDAPKPSSLGDFKIPTVGEGRPIPIVWGTCKLSGPVVTWYGDLLVQTIRKWVATGWWGLEGKHVIIGYRYWFGMQLILCSGEIDEVLQVNFDDRSRAKTITVETDRSNVFVDAFECFGGNNGEGGLWGHIYVYHGTQTQEPDAYLAQHKEPPLEEDPPEWDVPAYRGVCYAVFPLFYFGMSPYIKGVSFIIRRCPNSLGLSGGAENINGDANAAAMIYELLTSPPNLNGLGLPAEMIDADAFREVGQTLATEELGLSMLQDQTTAARDLIIEILKHVDATIYVEPLTGLLTMKLVRFDYDVDDLPVLDSNNCTVKSFSRPSLHELKNTVRVSYVGRNDGGGIT